MTYACNCVWLIVPVLLLNALFMKRLPKGYQPEEFSRDIPGWLGVGENGLRPAVFFLPVLMRLSAATAIQKAGWFLYLSGLVLYSLAWALQIRYPDSAWSVSRWGFLAPAYTPLLWLSGIALIGDSLFVPVRYSSWTYLGLSLVFLAFHNSHAWRVYSRLRGNENAGLCIATCVQLPK